MDMKTCDLLSNLIEAYQKAFPGKQFDAIKQVVITFKKEYLQCFKKTLEKEKREKKRQFNKSRLLVQKFKDTDIYKKALAYDLFRVLRAKVSENDISNVIASVIDPSKSPFGKEILTKIVHKSKLKESARIGRIIQRTPENRFVCMREYPGELSRIDLRIFTKDFHSAEKSLVIDFEIKVEGGSETKKGKKFQTEREYCDLKEFAVSQGIPLENVLAFFVTPHGSYAVSKEFIPLATSELRDIILEVLKSGKIGKKSNFDECGIAAISHFFNSGYVF